MDKWVFDFEIAGQDSNKAKISTVRGAGTLFYIETLERNGARVVLDSNTGRMVPASLLDESGRLIGESKAMTSSTEKKDRRVLKERRRRTDYNPNASVELNYNLAELSAELRKLTLPTNTKGTVEPEQAEEEKKAE